MTGWPFLTLVEAVAWIRQRVIEPELRGKVRVVRRFDHELGKVVEAYAEVGHFTLLEEATATLQAALARGELVATGDHEKTKAREVIPGVFWVRARIDATGLRPGRPGGRAFRRNGYEPWLDITIDRRELEGAWPQQPASERKEKLSIKAERDCEPWLAKLAEGGPPGPPKAEARDNALREFPGLSARGFERVWRRLADRPENAWMRRAGRKSRR